MFSMFAFFICICVLFLNGKKYFEKICNKKSIKIGTLGSSTRYWIQILYRRALAYWYGIVTRRFKNTVVSRIFVLKMDANLNLIGLRLMAMYSVVSLAYIIWGICGSLLPPFFPNEAMSKRASISQSGFVFGVFSLAKSIKF